MGLKQNPHFELGIKEFRQIFISDDLQISSRCITPIHYNYIKQYYLIKSCQMLLVDCLDYLIYASSSWYTDLFLPMKKVR